MDQTATQDQTISYRASSGSFVLTEDNSGAQLLDTNPTPVPRVEVIEENGIWILHGFLSEQECANLTQISEKVGYEVCFALLIPYSTSQDSKLFAHLYYGTRNNDRLILDDVSLAKALYERVKKYCPEIIDVTKIDPYPGKCILDLPGSSHLLVQLEGLNERWRFCRYDVGQKFAKHCDGSYNRNHSHWSFLTCMFYLNEDFDGGHTVFFDREGTETYRIVPKTGEEITKGRKYIMRSDVMYKCIEDRSEIPNRPIYRHPIFDKT